MSVRTGLPSSSEHVLETETPLFRLVALIAALTVILTFTRELYEVTVIVGGTGRFLAVVFGALLAATVVALLADVRLATVFAAGIGTAGFGWYLLTIPDGVDMISYFTGTAVGDTLALMSGVSVLLITDVSIWAASVAAVPVFLTWYFALRRRYGLAAASGGTLVLFLVLTGDLGLFWALVGVVAGLCTVSFGELELRGGSAGQLDLLIVLLAVIAASGLLLTVIPAGDGTTLASDGAGSAFGGSGGGSADIEGSLLTSDDQLTVTGEAELTPEVRFTVWANEPRRWRVGTYDRYTGDGWASTADSEPYDGGLSPQSDPSRSVRQQYEIEAAGNSMPAAAQPIRVSDGARDYTLVRDDGTLKPRATFSEGDTYSVRSQVPSATSGVLAETGKDYPDDVQEQYTQVPGSTPDRVEELTDEITADAENPYEEAVLIQNYLQSEKTYSLSVEEPSGDITDQFLFEMEAGYCTYYATAMATMLRTQDIPTRMVVGYNTGQEVDDNTYLVRGSDAHAWVEVYFEDHGWVEFDPTPSADWERARSDAVTEGRSDDVDLRVDTDASRDQPYTRNLPDTDQQSDPVQGGVLDTELDGGDGPRGLPDNFTEEDVESLFGQTAGDANSTTDESEREEDDTSVSDRIPSRERLTVLFALFVGSAAAAHRTGATTRARRTVGRYWQRPGVDPDEDAQRAATRVEHYLEQQYRPRDPSESRVEYLDGLPFTLDDRIHRVFDIAERAQYGDGVERAEADEAIEIADELVSETIPILRRFR